MSYASGETPVVGDYVKNRWEQPGTVTRVHESKDGQEYISMTWDDGEVDLLSAPAVDFTLISRQA